MILSGYLLSYVYLFGVILLIGALQKLFRFDVEISRKVIHFFIGFVWLILYRYHAGTWHFLVVPFSFIVINYASYKLKIFKMFEREDEKNHYGTIFYAISMTVMSGVSLIWPQTLIPYGIAVFCLSFGDAAAALCGGYIRKGNRMITKEKSLYGTLGAIVFSVLGIFLFLLILPTPLQLWQILLLGVATGLLELAGKGLDNFTLPFGILALATLFLQGA
jgi:phytol kinase